MNPASQDRFVAMRSVILEVLGSDVSPAFLSRVDAILNDWHAEKITAAHACEKVQKIVSLFIDENKSKEIGSRCAMIVMRESASKGRP